MTVELEAMQPSYLANIAIWQTLLCVHITKLVKAATLQPILSVVVVA